MCCIKYPFPSKTNRYLSCALVKQSQTKESAFLAFWTLNIKQAITRKRVISKREGSIFQKARAMETQTKALEMGWKSLRETLRDGSPIKIGGKRQMVGVLDWTCLAGGTSPPWSVLTFHHCSTVHRFTPIHYKALLRLLIVLPMITCLIRRFPLPIIEQPSVNCLKSHYSQGHQQFSPNSD